MFNTSARQFGSGSLRSKIDGSLSAILLAVSALYYVGGTIAIVLQGTPVGA
jgi:hypothetical protein